MGESEREPTQLKRLHARVHGRVQGVGFRAYTVDRARSLGLVGYVCNHWDRSVQVVAQGESSAVAELLAWLHEGPPFAHVSRVDVTWETPIADCDDFEVRF
ncbi:MAG: acylphosphatase [Anaerolineae bacterium]